MHNDWYTTRLEYLDSFVIVPFQELRFRWSVQMWKSWLWQVLNIMEPSRLIFPQKVRSHLLRSALQNSLADQTSSTRRGRTRCPRLWRAKNSTATPSPVHWVSSNHAQQIQNATLWVRQRPLIFLCLQNGVWHQVAITFLSSPSLEYLDYESVGFGI